MFPDGLVFHFDICLTQEDPLHLCYLSEKLMKTFFLAAFLATIGTGVFAHSGGLNASGCHNNRKTGGYHCHRAAAPAPTIRSQNNNRPQSLFGNGGGAYRNCSEARAAGAAPVYRGDPGYGSHLDRDNDGVGCE